MASWWKYLFNPVGAIVQDVNKSTGKAKWLNMLTNPGDFAYDTYNLIKGFGKKSVEGMVTQGIENLTGSDVPDISTGIKTIYDDLTGKSQMERQNEINREMAEEEYQRNLQSIGDTAAAYEAAGFNRNLLYSKDGVSYSAPQLQAYSGSKKIDTILSRVGTVLGMIPAMYQATAALEGIDQARERTKQSEIKTMSMGMSLLDQGYKLGDIRLSHPFTPTIEPFSWSDKRHVKPIDYSNIRLSKEGFSEFDRYADASLQHQFDLLRSIGIKNEMNSTLNNWRGYQYSLDRRFGAAGRITGMATQGVRALGSLFTPIKLGGFK